MSKGSPIIPIRIPAEVLASMDLTIVQRNTYTHNEPWSRSSFIISAIKDKIAKMERSRSGRAHKSRKVD